MFSLFFFIFIRFLVCILKIYVYLGIYSVEWKGFFCEKVLWLVKKSLFQNSFQCFRLRLRKACLVFNTIKKRKYTK